MSARPTVVVVGLGPGDPRFMNQVTLDEIARVQHRYVRTTRHPSVPKLGEATSFDELYDNANSMASVYEGIVERLVAMADRHGEVLYAVPGSPMVAEHTVELLCQHPAIDVKLVPALSFLELAWIALRVDPLANGASIVDGHRFVGDVASRQGPFLVCQCDSKEILSDIKLSIDTDLAPYHGTGPKVTVLQWLGTDREQVFTVDWEDLDKSFEPDHLTSLWIDELTDTTATSLIKLDQITHQLRRECPWDREQTLNTMTLYLIEEAYEVVEAIESGDPQLLLEELGDLLFQVYLQSVICEEQGEFKLADVANAITEKMIRRHPHVFPPTDGTSMSASNAKEVLANWETIKKSEAETDSVMTKLPKGLPSLLFAHKVQFKASNIGFDWPDVAGPMSKVEEEFGELRAALVRLGRVVQTDSKSELAQLAQTNAGYNTNVISEDDAQSLAEVASELGDLLFSVVNVARKLEIDPETALRSATSKFLSRFLHVEAQSKLDGVVLGQLTIEELDGYWNSAKRAKG